jgi:hypothetical protein
MAGLASRLLALKELHAVGILSDDEFARAKARLIADYEQASPAPAAAAAPPPPPPPAPPKTPTLNPVVPGVGLALGAAAIANGGLGG